MIQDTEVTNADLAYLYDITVIGCVFEGRGLQIKSASPIAMQNR